MKLNKSTRHSKITGNFAENLILYWLSKYGFETALVDHTGIDLIAKNPHNGELMGISVKSRSRNTGKEGQYVSIPNKNIPKVESACEAFGCIPYFAIVVDEDNTIYSFILSMEHLLVLFPQGQKTIAWKMSEKWLETYRKDNEIKIFEFKHETTSWWNGRETD